MSSLNQQQSSTVSPPLSSSSSSSSSSPSSSSSHNNASNPSDDENRSFIEKEIGIFVHPSTQVGRVDRTGTKEFVYHTVRGVENILIYTWIAKDLCWLLYSPDWIYFGIGALCICGVVVVKSISEMNFEDVWHRVAEFLWLFANFWWMSVSAI